MPLLDHFHPPLKGERHWESFHSFWASAIVAILNDTLLPQQYFAEPHVKLGSEAEIDVATHEDEDVFQGEQNGGIATAVYAPSKPALTFPVNFAELDTFEIQVREEDSLKLVAAIELVSPANKDRPSHRHAFVRKCASYLQNEVSVIVVDVVTDRAANLHAELIEELDSDVTIDDDDANLRAVAYRVNLVNHIEVWPARLELGQPLPTLPLWLSPALAVPVDLEQSYVAACKALRIRLP